jgi:hypothetical protein
MRGAPGSTRNVPFAGYASKTELLTRFAGGKQVLHLGAVGCTLESVDAKIATTGALCYRTTAFEDVRDA